MNKFFSNLRVLASSSHLGVLAAILNFGRYFGFLSPTKKIIRPKTIFGLKKKLGPKKNFGTKTNVATTKNFHTNLLANRYFRPPKQFGIQKFGWYPFNSFICFYFQKCQLLLHTLLMPLVQFWDRGVCPTSMMSYYLCQTRSMKTSASTFSKTCKSLLPCHLNERLLRSLTRTSQVLM